MKKEFQDLDWLKCFIKYIRVKNPKLYDEAVLYSDEIKDGCI